MAQREIDGSINPSQIPMRDAVWMLLTTVSALESIAPGKAKQFLTSNAIGLDEENATKLIAHARTAVEAQRTSGAQDAQQLCHEVTRAKGTTEQQQAISEGLQALQDKEDQRREQLISALTSVLDEVSERKVLAWADIQRAAMKISEIDIPSIVRTLSADALTNRICGANADQSGTVVRYQKEERK